MLKCQEEIKRNCKAKQYNTIIGLTNKLEIKEQSRHNWRVTDLIMNIAENYKEMKTIREQIKCSHIDYTKYE